MVRGLSAGELGGAVGFEIGCSVSVECCQNKRVILKDRKILWPVRMKYDKIPVKAGGEALNTDTAMAKNPYG